MRVAVVASGDFFSDYGGGQVYVRNIIKEFVRRTDITTSVISFNNSLQTCIKEYLGISVYQVNNEETLRDVIKNIKPDIVHSNGEKLIASRICKQLGIPCIVTAHHGGIVCPAGALLNAKDEICRISAEFNHCIKCYLRNTKTGPFWYPLLRHYTQQRYIRIGQRLKQMPFIPFLSPIGETGLIVYEKLEEWRELSESATHFIAPSNAIADALKRNGCSQSKITVIPHGIPQTLNINHQSSIINHINFYYIGRINYIKGVHIMLEAFNRLTNENIELHIIGGSSSKGDTKYEKKLRCKYRKDNRIIWHGKIDYEKTSAMTSQFDCLIHPAICMEIFGLDIAEALQQSNYVIATRCGGAEMQIHNENEGVLVEPNNVTELQVAIKQYINHPIQSSAHVKSIDDHVTELIKVYKSVTIESKNSFAKD